MVGNCTLRDKLSPQLFAFAHRRGCPCDCEVTDCRIVLWDDDGQYVPAEPDIVSTEANYRSLMTAGASALSSTCGPNQQLISMSSAIYKPLQDANKAIQATVACTCARVGEPVPKAANTDAGRV